MTLDYSCSEEDRIEKKSAYVEEVGALYNMEKDNCSFE